MLTRELLASYIDAGAGRIKADMAVMGGTLINVNTGEYYQADVAIYKGKITAVEKDISDYIDDHTKIIVRESTSLRGSLTATSMSNAAR